MKSDLFRVHGDNIVECERIIKIIKNSIEIKHETRKFISQAVVEYNLEFFHNGKIHNWRIELFPGFNKRGRSRWGYNIFESLKAKGSFLDETPDAILTKVIGSKEIVVLAIEFSSALNAGNQAWQRSGRAYSTAKIGVPYLYLDEFVRYEINSSTRSRKNLRFPNAAIPYSYINMSNAEETFLAQCFIKSEEFDRTNPVLKNFSENIFSFNDIGDYIILSLLDCDVSDLENRFKLKNLEMVKFLSPDDNSDKSKSEISKDEWEEIYNGKIDIIDVSKRKKLVFNKIIQSKSITASSKTNEFNNLVKKYAYGISSEGLPFGCIPKEKRKNFLEELVKIYTIDDKFKEFIQNQNKDLLICLVKGFKPRGDDNRPDRGILPFLSMLTSDKNEI